jgi:TetR/AcrR family transcriptional regulator, ethionamide resistance regulator
LIDDHMSQKTTTRQTRERSRARIIDAAAELVGERSYAELNVGEIMERAGIGRTLFYRHFDDLADLLLRVASEAIDDLYEAQLALGETRSVDDPATAIRDVIELPVAVYSRHGPLLRALSEASAADSLVAARQAPLRARFDAMVEEAVRSAGAARGNMPADPAESARALNRLNEGYLLDAFGREPRVSTATAIETLTEIWTAFFSRAAPRPGR